MGERHNFIGEIEEVIWNKGPNRVYFKGFAFIETLDIDTNEKVKKSFIITNKIKKFIIPAANCFRSDITSKYGFSKFNYSYSGFEGFIDLGFINDMNPISEGEWSISMYINSNGVEREYPIKYSGVDIKEENKVILNRSKNKKSIIALDLSDKLIRLKVKEESVKPNYKVKTNEVCSKIIKELHKFKRSVGRFVFTNIYKIMKLFNVKVNRVAFLSDSRNSFTGNFEFVYNEIKDNGLYDIKYMLKSSISEKRSFIEKIKFLYYISTSKYILLDDYYPQIYKYNIKSEIEVIQLWHATGAFKTFGFSRLGKPGGPKVRSKNHRNYTKAIVSSSNIKKHYAEAFGISENRVISTGIPRTDIFFDDNYKKEKIDYFYKTYQVLKDKKVILFAPTFRGHGQKGAYYDFDKLDLEKLYNFLGEDYLLIMKLHPFIKGVSEIDERYKDFVIDLSHEREINDLLFIADILITDYSSVCFEFALLNRPMIFFAYDLEEYIASRDFYYPYESFVPGPIVKTTDGIIEVIKNNDFKYEKLEKFREQFFDHFDGKSTKRVVDMLLKL